MTSLAATPPFFSRDASSVVHVRQRPRTYARRGAYGTTCEASFFISQYQPAIPAAGEYGGSAQGDTYASVDSDVHSRAYIPRPCTIDLSTSCYGHAGPCVRTHPCCRDRTIERACCTRRDDHDFIIHDTSLYGTTHAMECQTPYGNQAYGVIARLSHGQGGYGGGAQG